MKNVPDWRTSTGTCCNYTSFRYFLFIAPVIAWLLAGCTFPGNMGSGVDTCTQGENMTNPRLMDGLQDMEGGSKITITWETGTEQGSQLPEAYFQAVTLSNPADTIRSVALTAEREITIEFADLSSNLQTEDTLELLLEFPDRREYISCRHAGMNDLYYLKITLTFTPNGVLEDASFDQGIRLGPI